ncbi:hypothetical protein J6590_027166 [Homalodisca vitripennis]|nr:hypothetical protein J6590_027166 [Homalodisca vitripennis]
MARSRNALESTPLHRTPRYTTRELPTVETFGLAYFLSNQYEIPSLNVHGIRNIIHRGRSGEKEKPALNQPLQSKLAGSGTSLLRLAKTSKVREQTPPTPTVISRSRLDLSNCP